MNGQLAALVAICLHGNAWLASGVTPAPSVDTENSTFQFVRQLHVTCPQQLQFRTRAWETDAVAPWLQFLRATGGRRLSLVTAGRSESSGPPDPVAASFANGVQWALVNDGPSPRIWFPQWSWLEATDPADRGWAVQITGQPVGQVLAPALPPLAARINLLRALVDTRAFAASADLDDWAAWFTKALAQVEELEPTVPYHPDLAPATLPLESRQLLAAAVQAWVFGGMGSWNDLGFTDDAQQRRYIDLTQRLYDAVLAALTTVVNAQTG